MSSATLTKMYHLGNENDNICYQTNYTDPHFVSDGYVPGFCPFQLVLSTDVETICNGHSEENTKYCPDSQIQITIYKMGKSSAVKEKSANAVSLNVSIGSEHPSKGFCNVRACGCSPYRRPWCTKRNAFVRSPWCQSSQRRCQRGCNQVWCREGPAPPKPPAPSPAPAPAHILKVFF